MGASIGRYSVQEEEESLERVEIGETGNQTDRDVCVEGHLKIN